MTASTVTAAIPLFQVLYKLRYACMGANVVPFGGRASNVAIFRDSQILDRDFLNNLPPPPGSVQLSTGITVSGDPDQAKACALLRLNCSDVIRGSLFMAGIPDAVITTFPDGPNIALVPSWGKLLNKYISELQSGRWGMVARNYGAVTPVASWIQDPTTGNLVAVINGGMAVTPGVTKVQVRGVKRTNRAYQPANGTWIVSQYTSGPGAGQNSLMLFASNNVPVTSFLSLGNLQIVDYSSYAYSSVNLIGNSTRKRGNRSLAYPGRRVTHKYLSL